MIYYFFIRGILYNLIITSFVIETANNSITDGTVIILPNGNYTASSLAATLTSSLQTICPEIGCSCNYNGNVGTNKITSPSNSQFSILTDGTIVSLQGIDWYGDGGDHLYSPDIT